MKKEHTCGQCGKPLPAGSPQGLCPECLLRAGLESVQIATSSTGQTTAANIATQTTVAEGPVVEPGNVSPECSARERLHYFGDYELLEEIAQGGMGVIYKARQVSLNRIVAVKMILAGEFATEAEVKRFRVEAEAAANLQHPNIVAIHEVGVHEGRHYFSMDYVAGKNLALTLAGKPLPAGRAATLLKTLAEAVHYAHQRGTLHRDLKPQNVLLDEQGQPRITDFGLAKRVREDSGLTRSGAVMGSPSYMPPEQAAGRWGELGPPSDVYALGAILYEMLTGRAPFKRETVTATLVQVLEEEPVPPRQLNPAVPVDLETICLKCLEKRPERRYASARALGEELERYLNHEPILARPASRMRKGWSWLQKHPWAITGMAALIIVGLACTAYGMWQQGRYQLWQSAHPEEVFRPGFQPLLITALFGMTLVGSIGEWIGRALRRHFRRHREQGAPIPRTIVGVNIGAGAVTIVYTLALLFKQVELWAWQPPTTLPGGELNVFPMAVYTLFPCALVVLWSGAIQIWTGLGACELSAFSEIVAQKMEAADAEEVRISRQKTRVRSLKERLLNLVVPLVFFGLMFAILVLFLLLQITAEETNRVELKTAVWTTGIAAWLVPAWWVAQHRRWENNRRETLKRTAIIMGVVLVSWAANAGANGWALGLALALGCGSVGLFSGLAMSLDQGKSAPRGGGDPNKTFRLSSLLVDVNPFTAGRLGFTILIAVLIGAATLRIWREASTNYAYLEELAANGKALSRQSYLKSRVPDEVNFAKNPVLQALGSQIRFDTNRWVRYAAVEALMRAQETVALKSRSANASQADQTNPIVANRGVQATEMLRVMTPLAADFDELRQAAVRPFAQIDAEPMDPAQKPLSQPYWPAYRLLARLFLVHATAELEMGRPGAAWNDLRVVQRLADALTGNRRLTSTTIRVALVQTCQEGFWEGWATGRWTDGELRQWEGWLATVDLLRDLDITLRGEEPFFVNSIYDVPSAFAQGVPILLWGSFREQRLYNQLVFGFCGTAYSVLRQEVFPARAQAFQDQAKKTLKEKSVHWPPASLYYPLQDQMLMKTARVQTMINLSLLAGALTLYQRDNKQLPTHLDEISPSYLPRIPHDLIGGKPLIYRRANDRLFLLYSVGWNERDDGGMASSGTSELAGGDWIWPRTASNDR